MIRFVVAAAYGLVLTGPALAQRAVPPAPPPDNAANSIDGAPLVYLGDKRPILMRLRVEVDGKSIHQAWRDYVKKWFDYLDRDADGKLNSQELRHAPREQGLLQMLRSPAFGQPLIVGGGFLMAHLGKKEDETIRFDELFSYYQSRNVSPVQMTSGDANRNAVVFSPDGRLINANTDPATLGEILFRTLDADKDGKLSRAELTQAPESMRRLDIDDNELITTEDMVPTGAGGLRPPLPRIQGPTAGTKRVGAFFLPSGSADSSFAGVLLTQYDQDKNRNLSRTESGLSKEPFEALDANQDGDLDGEELARWHLRPSDVTFTVRLGRTNGAAVDVDKNVDKKLAAALTTVADGQVLSLGDVELRIARDPTPPIRFAAQGQLLQIFRQADKRNRGFVEMTDLQGGGQLPALRQAFPMLDRDGDAKVTLKEVQAFIELQAEAANNFVSLSVAEHGRNLFQLVDANGDNRLSPRELQSVWTRLQVRDSDGDGFIDTTELARVFQVTVERGSNIGFRGGVRGGFTPDAPRAAYARNAPAWFKKMDRNGDGDVSVREFLGTREEFNRIDADRDALISADEAERFETALRTKQ